MPSPRSAHPVHAPLRLRQAQRLVRRRVYVRQALLAAAAVGQLRAERRPRLRVTAQRRAPEAIHRRGRVPRNSLRNAGQLKGGQVEGSGRRCCARLRRLRQNCKLRHEARHVPPARRAVQLVQERFQGGRVDVAVFCRVLPFNQHRPSVHSIGHKTAG